MDVDLLTRGEIGNGCRWDEGDVGPPQRMRVLARIWESDRLKLSRICLLDATTELLPGKVSCAVICPAAWREHRASY